MTMKEPLLDYSIKPNRDRCYANNTEQPDINKEQVKAQIEQIFETMIECISTSKEPFVDTLSRPSRSTHNVSDSI